MGRQPPERNLAPVAARYRLRYSKSGRMRFASHRDFQRALERAIRRARLPIAFSAGFSPHPRISYTNSVPTGAASDAEYLELGLTRPVDIPEMIADLNDSLPDGFRIETAVPAEGKDFANRLQAGLWQVEMPGAASRDVEAAVDRLLQRDVVEVTRMTKKGERRMDVRSALLSLQMVPDDSGQPEPVGPGCVILHMVVRHQTPAVRPDDVLTALRQAGGLDVPRTTRLRRLSQGPLGEDTVIGDPLTGDQAVVAEV